MRNVLRTGLITALTAVAAVGFAPPTLAHVKVSGTNARQGGYGVLTFSVPSESDAAATTELRVFLPDTAPIYLVEIQPKPGWTAILIKRPLPTPQTDYNGTVHNDYVSQVDWKADTPQAAIPPNQFELFRISAGPLPNRDSLVLPAEQSYSDGRTVNWNDDPFAGPPAPGHPAPVLKLVSGASDIDIFTTTETVQDNTPLWPALAAAAVAVVALLLAITNFVLLRRRKD